MTIFAKIRELLAPRRAPCEQVNAFLADYVEGVIDPVTRERFEAHLRACPNCDVYLEQYRTTVDLVRVQQPAEPPEELVERTIAFLRTHWEEEERS